ncbi:MAG: helix-turn-helix transcriptional regulator [Atopobiaceae bacterium]|nr:helix-turn-helix transcriptional regulator [Atopobiaceae bacterium]
MPRRRLTLDPRYKTPADTRVLRMADFGALVRRRRKELGMTQRDLSRLTGYSMRLIGEVERGKEHVAADKLLSILDVLNMTMTVHVEGK